MIRPRNSATASDDPVAAAQAERALTRLSRIQTEQRALETQRNAIAQAESAMGDAVGLVQNARELIVSAGNGTLTPNDRATIANQLQGLREQLSEVANRKDTNGVPLLGALGSALSPFLGPLSTSPDYDFKGRRGSTAARGWPFRTRWMAIRRSCFSRSATGCTTPASAPFPAAVG